MKKIFAGIYMVFTLIAFSGWTLGLVGRITGIHSLIEVPLRLVSFPVPEPVFLFLELPFVLLWNINFYPHSFGVATLYPEWIAAVLNIALLILGVKVFLGEFARN